MDAVSKSNAAEFDAVLDDVFTRISSCYERFCDVFSLLAHRYWKSTIARQIAPDRRSTVLDVASGTGDIAIRVARQKGTKDKVIIAGDIYPGMLPIAKRKAGDRTQKMDFRYLKAHQLQFVGGCVRDCLRNEDLRPGTRTSRGFSRVEARRTRLLPGGLANSGTVHSFGLPALHGLVFTTDRPYRNRRGSRGI